MTFTEDFERWWRDVGQTIPPCDSLGSADRELFRQFARNISRDVNRDINENEVTEDEHDTNVQAILDDEKLTSPEKVKKIIELYENQ